MKKFKITLVLISIINIGLLTSQNTGINVTNPQSKLHIDGKIKINGTNALEFGAGLVKEENAGKIIYNGFSSGLDIIGGGTTLYNRRVNFIGNTIFNKGIHVPSLSTYSALNDGLSSKEEISFIFGFYEIKLNGFDDIVSNLFNVNFNSNRTIRLTKSGNLIIGPNFHAATLNVNQRTKINNLRLGSPQTGQYLFNNSSYLAWVTKFDPWVLNTTHLVSSGSKIGIGTSTPLHPMHIAGTVKSDSLKIQVAVDSTFFVTSSSQGLTYFKPAFENWSTASNLQFLGTPNSGYTYSLGSPNAIGFWSMTQNGQTNLKFGLDNVLSIYTHTIKSNGLLTLNPTTAISSNNGLVFGANRPNLSKLNIDTNGHLGLGRETSSAKIDVANDTKTESIKIGNNGSKIVRMNQGSTNITKPSPGMVGTQTINFQNGYFTATPKVIAIVKAGSIDTQVYCVSTTNISVSSVTFLIYRLDNNLAWPSEPTVEWIAIQ
jgi:hypothetical protein